jgi:putative acyl-CoA dehydrogenase
VLGAVGELAASAGDLPGAAATAHFIEQALQGAENEFPARRAVEKLAQLAAAEAMRATASPFAETFARTRLGDGAGATYGARDLSREEADGLIARVMPGG